MKLRLLILAVIACAAGACGDDDTGTNPTPTPVRITSNFVGTVDVGSAAIFPYSVSQTGGQSVVTFGSLTNSAGLPINAVMGLGIGVASDTDCAVTNSVEAAPSLQVAMTVAAPTGNLCVRIADIGNLRESATFAIRVVHP